MQNVKLRSAYNLQIINKIFLRTVAVNTASAREETTTDSEKLKPWKEVPGPSSLPFIGQLHNFLPGGALYNVKGFHLWKILHEMYGPIVRLDSVLGIPPTIFLFHAESIEQILRGENWLPIRPVFESLKYYRFNRNNKDETRPTGLLTDQGNIWKNFRSTVNPVLLQPKTIRLYTKLIDEVAMDMIARMKALRGENNMIQGKFDVQMNLFALESIGVVALGTRLNCFDPNLSKNSPERKLMQCVQELFHVIDEIEFKPNLWRYYPTPTYKKAMKLYADLDEVTKYFINKGMENLKNKNTKSDDEKSVLEKLLEINEEVAYVMASDMFFAGVDTVANTMCAVLYLLASNPDKQDKLREELTLGKEQRPYLKACIKESIRMMPVLGGNTRQTSKEYNILNYRIPPGLTILFGHPFLSMMDSNFPRPKEYIPERWIADKSDPFYYGNADKFAFSPFGFGVRSCIGQRIAELEMETFLARIIQNFKVEWFGSPPEIKSTSLNYVVGPFNFVFEDV